MTRAKIADVERKMVELEAIKRVLDRLAATCRGKGPTSECPILDLLDEEETRCAGD